MAQSKRFKLWDVLLSVDTIYPHTNTNLLEMRVARNTGWAQLWVAGLVLSSNTVNLIRDVGVDRFNVVPFFQVPIICI